MRVQDKVFIVTGGGAGIGREVVLGLLARGASVAAVDLNEVGLSETASLADAGERLALYPLNVTDRPAVEAMVSEVKDRFGQVDGLINVAGIIQPFVRLVELPFETIEKVMAVNFWGVVNTTKAALPLLMARGQSCIVNVSSMGGFNPVPGQTVYGASKAAVKLLTEGLYAECVGTPVRVTVVFPGAIRTDITGNSGVTNPGAEHLESKVPMTSPAEAARQIIEDGVIKGRYRVRIGNDAKVLDLLSRLSPKLANRLMGRVMRTLLDR